MKGINNLVKNFNELNLTYMKLTPREDYNKISRKKNYMFSEMPGVALSRLKDYAILKGLQWFKNAYLTMVGKQIKKYKNFLFFSYERVCSQWI